MPQPKPLTARKLTESDIDFLNSMLRYLTCTPLEFIQSLKQTAISAQEYQQAATLRDIEKALLRNIE